MTKRHNVLKSSRRRDWLLGDFMKPSAEPHVLRRRKVSHRKPSVLTFSKHLHGGKQPSGHQSFLLTVTICHSLSVWGESRALSLIQALQHWHQCSPSSTPCYTCCPSGTCPYTVVSLWYINPSPSLLSVGKGESTHLCLSSPSLIAPSPWLGHTVRVLPTTRVLHVARWWWLKEQMNKNGGTGEGKLCLKVNTKLPLPLPLSLAGLTLHRGRNILIPCPVHADDL